MEGFQERVVKEKANLDARLKFLTDFIASDKFNHVQVPEQMRLRRQELIMEMYSDVLAERIMVYEKEERT